MSCFQEENPNPSGQQSVGTGQSVNQYDPIQLLKSSAWLLYCWTIWPVLMFFKYLFCIDTVQSVVGHTKRGATESMARISESYRRHREREAILSDISAYGEMSPEECFQYDIRRKGYKGTNIGRTLSMYRDLWFLTLIVGVGSIWGGLLSGEYYWYGFAAVCIAIMINLGFTHYNIRHGRIVTVAHGRLNRLLGWLFASPSEWVPVPFDGRVVSGLMAVILASAGSAAAATATVSVDIFALFQTALSGADGFNAAMQVFLCQLMVLGTFMFAGCVILGTAATGHEGRVLGKNSHQMWTPIKWLIGLGTLVPVNGSNIAMQLLLIVATFGNGIADQETAIYVNTIANRTGSPTYTPAGVQPSIAGIALVKQIAINEVCRASYATTAQYSGTNADYVPPEPPTGGTPVGTDTIRYSWGRNCGTIELSSSVITQNVDQDALNQYLQAWNAAFSKARDAVRNSNIPSNFALSRQPGSGVQAPAAVMMPLKPIAAQYESDVAAAAAALLSSTGTWSQYAASVTHWPLLGVADMTLAAMQGQVSSIMGILPEMVGPSLGDSILNYDITREADRTVKLFLERWGSEVEADTAGPSASVITEITANDNADWVNGTLQKLMNPVTVSILQEFGASNPNNALAVECDYGHRLVDLSFGMMAASTTAMVAVGNTAGQVTGVYAGAQWLSGFAWLIIGALLTAGIVSAYIVPLWPFLTMVSAVVGYIIEIIAGYLTISFSSLAMIKTSGAELMDEILRPAALYLLKIAVHASAITLPFILVKYVMPIFLYWIDVYYPVAFISSQAGHTSVLTGNVVALWVMGALKFQTVMRFYALPIQVVGWIGRLINGWARDGSGEAQFLQQIQGGSDPSGGAGQATGKLEHGSSQGMQTLASASKRHNSPAPMNP